MKNMEKRALAGEPHVSEIVGEGRVLRVVVKADGAICWYLNGTAIARKAVVAEYGEYLVTELASDRLPRIAAEAVHGPAAAIALQDIVNAIWRHRTGDCYGVLKDLGREEGLLDPAGVVLTPGERSLAADMLILFGGLTDVATRLMDDDATPQDMRAAAEVQRFTQDPALVCLAPDPAALPVAKKITQNRVKRILDSVTG